MQTNLHTFFSSYQLCCDWNSLFCFYDSFAPIPIVHSNGKHFSIVSNPDSNSKFQLLRQRTAKGHRNLNFPNIVWLLMFNWKYSCDSGMSCGAEWPWIDQLTFELEAKKRQREVSVLSQYQFDFVVHFNAIYLLFWRDMDAYRHRHRTFDEWMNENKINMYFWHYTPCRLLFGQTFFFSPRVFFFLLLNSIFIYVRPPAMMYNIILFYLFRQNRMIKLRANNWNNQAFGVAFVAFN